MERLNVITVPAADWDHTRHTAFTVYADSAGTLRISAGWTLRDAVDRYAREYGVQKDGICLARPFVTQEKHLRKQK